ncbi:site-specific integrase, partial [Arcobacter porcinus]
MLGKRASANAVINAIMSKSNGIGTSKIEAKNSSNLKGQNGHKISSKAHSISSMQNLRTVTTQYVNYVKENYKGRVLENINQESVRSFLNTKQEVLKGSSLNTYISSLGKVADNLKELGYNNINRQEIVSYRDDFDTSKEHINRAYNNPQEIINNMQNNSPYGLSAELQYKVGLRVDDALNSSKWTINNIDNTLTISGSKGGINYQTAPLSNSLLEKVREAKEQEYKGNYTEYRETLKENSQEWHGTHGLRYNFAQNRVL